MNRITKHQRIEMRAGKSLTVDTRTVWYDHPVHWHSFFEIEIILSGAGKYVINDVEYDIAGPNVFLLTPTDFHYLKVAGAAEIINISFDETMMSDGDMTALIFNKVKKAYSLDSAEYARIVNLARVLEHECSIDGDCSEALLKYVIKCLLRKNSVMPSLDPSDSFLRDIRRAIIYMELHFREDIDLPRVAAEAGYTPTYFSRLFKRATGKTFVDMLTTYRLGYAKTLLANGISVAEACFSSGFGSLTAFRDAFKRAYGISPNQYKERGRANKSVSR